MAVALAIRAIRTWMWVPISALTIVLQWGILLIVPQYTCACAPSLDLLLISAIPLLWTTLLVASYRGGAERAVAWMGFGNAAVAFLLMNQWAWS